nr:hypothetical protein ISGA_131 [Gordonia sp. NB41Y]
MTAHRRRTRHVLLMAGMVACSLLAGCAAPESDSIQPPVSSTAPEADDTATQPVPGTGTERPEESSSAQTTLDSLPVKGRAPKTGYSRAQFGQSWTDDVDVAGGHNGCDTRNDILRRDLTDITVKPGTRECVVLSGTLDDPYTGTTVRFTRGTDTSSQVQIDHVVALADAWQKGAQNLTPEKRADLANDPRNLQATIGSVNQSKGAGDAATWLPPNKAYRCTYAERQIEVKAAYGLWVTAAERDALARLLDDC